MAIAGSSQEHSAIVRRHVVEQRRNVFLGHALEQGFFCVLLEILEDSRGIFSREHAEDDDLVLDSERSEQFGELAGVPVPHHVAQAGVVAAVQHRRELLGGTSRLAERRQCLVPVGTGELLFHLCQSRTNDIMVMDVRAHRLDGIQPDAMNEIDVGRG